MVEVIKIDENHELNSDNPEAEIDEMWSIGKRNTQKIERKHLTLRTRIKRLARKTICFSRKEQRHDIVIGLFVNRYEFGLAVQTYKQQYSYITPARRETLTDTLHRFPMQTVNQSGACVR